MFGPTLFTADSMARPFSWAGPLCVAERLVDRSAQLVQLLDWIHQLDGSADALRINTPHHSHPHLHRTESPRRDFRIKA